MLRVRFCADAQQIAPRRTQRTENLDRYSIVKDRRNKPTLDLSRVECPLRAINQGAIRIPWRKYLWRPDGGADRDRTDDLGLAKPALSQLSYSPMEIGRSPSRFMVGLSGVEPLTSRLSGVRSSLLSYRPSCPSFSKNRVPSVPEN